MRRDQRKYLLYLRLRLGDALRRAHDRIEPLAQTLERGYRWEPDDVAAALSMAEDLRDAADGVAERIEEFADRYKKSLTPSERSRLVGGKKRGSGAVGGIRKAVQFLDDIERDEMAELEQKWLAGDLEDVSKGHEAYFLRRFNGAMKLLRLSWNAMFYATEKPSPRYIRLSDRQSAAFYNPMSDVAAAVRAQADELAEASGQYVEVYDSDNDLVYVGVPPTPMAAAELERARQRAKPRAKVRGAKRKEPTGPVRPNPNSDEVRDIGLLVEMWQWTY